MEKNRNHEGYEFVGRYVDEACTKRINPGGRLPKVMMLYDKWVPIWYPVQYNLHGGENDARNPHLISVESNAIELHPARKQGKIFAGWYWNSKKITALPQGIHEKIILDALFKNPYRIYFESSGGDLIETLYTDENGKAGPLPLPRRKGFRFGGWFSDYAFKSPFDPQTILKRDIRLYALWYPESCAVFYDTDGGLNSRRNPHSYIPFEKELLLYPASKKGYRFEGWVDEKGNKVEKIGLKQTGNLMLKAVFSAA